MSVNLDDFVLETECTYKNERYAVRDNGAVLRHGRTNKPLRKYDNFWTFGTSNNYGYMLIASEVVHRIVAYAFLGEPPTAQHIVDHVDTNRQNNRPENLRWLTKLENILNNPVTIKKIIFLCGSIEAFLKDPSIIKNHVSKDPNFGWMRTVTPEEAQISWRRLSNWAIKKNDSTPVTGNSLGEWVYGNSASFSELPALINSMTPNAVQKDWKTPAEFPCCPEGNASKPIATYASNLRVDEIFSQNQYSKSIITDFAIAKDENTFWVIGKSSDTNAVRPWLLAQVTYENNLFVHMNLGSFFKKDGADKCFALAQGLEWTGGETFDDLC